MKKYLMALDQGTTSSRCILFDTKGNAVAKAQKEYPQIFPAPGLVEHDPRAILSSQISVAAEALACASGTWDEVIGIGITNQRETVVVWDKNTGAPIANAIVWQDRRTADFCEALVKEGRGDLLREKTGLLPDPYFSASKIAWLLDHVEGARSRAEAGELLFGTVDTWLIWNLTGGKVHATDVSNASRTMLFNINTMTWDRELFDLFRIPRSMAPEVKPSSGIFGYTDCGILGGSVPIAGVAGDQQSALFGQCCFERGSCKNTYGTGGFLLMNTGDEPVVTNSGLLATVAWKIGDEVTYALEGSVFTAGSAIQWLRDGMKMIDSAADSEFYAREVPDAGGVFLVPAFTGLGAPWWDPYATGTIVGITRATTKNHVIRATVDSIAYQTADVIAMMEKVTGTVIPTLSVDGGAAANNLLLETQSSLLGKPVERPKNVETTAHGAALLAGLALGVYATLDEIRNMKVTDRTFTPQGDGAWRENQLRLWHKAVERSLGWRKA